MARGKQLNGQTETLVYGLRAGQTERYTEELLSSRCRNTADVEKVKAAASRDGWHSFRVARFTPGEKPDFVATIQGAE